MWLHTQLQHRCLSMDECDKKNKPDGNSFCQTSERLLLVNKCDWRIRNCNPGCQRIFLLSFCLNCTPLKSWLFVLQVRFACIISVGVVHLICALLLILRPNMMAFRVGGALERLQEQYFLLNLCFSMVTFDLQAQVSSYSLTIHTLIKGTCRTCQCFL